MTSELVAGSACTKPPVDGDGEAPTGVAAAALLADIPPSGLPAGFAGSDVLDVVGPPLPAPPPPDVNAARSTVASLTASAFFK